MHSLYSKPAAAGNYIGYSAAFLLKKESRYGQAQSLLGMKTKPVCDAGQTVGHGHPAVYWAVSLHIANLTQSADLGVTRQLQHTPTSPMA